MPTFHLTDVLHPPEVPFAAALVLLLAAFALTVVAVRASVRAVREQRQADVEGDEHPTGSMLRL